MGMERGPSVSNPMEWMYLLNGMDPDSLFGHAEHHADFFILGGIIHDQNADAAFFGQH